MRRVGVRLLGSACAALVAVSALSGCGRYPDVPDLPDRSDGPPSTWKDNLTITRCIDVPPLPRDEEDLSVARSSPEKTDKSHSTVTLFWAEGSDARPEFHEYVVRVDDPTCANRPDIRTWFKVHADPPRFEDAFIVVRPGQDRAYIGYTIVGRGENLYAQPGEVSGVSSSGRTVRWRNQTSTGGPADIVAMDGRHVMTPGSPDGGDGYFVDASSVKVGETVTFTFLFETGAVEARFNVVASA